MRLKKLAFTLAAQATFPDSGLYYSKIQREYDKLESEVKKLLKPLSFKKLCQFISKEYDRISYEYHSKAAFTDENGREWTVAELDEQMCYQ